MLNLLFQIKILIKIIITKEELDESKYLSKERKIPFVDCLLAVQARNHNAVLITQDKHILNNLKDKAKSIKPQDLNFLSK